MRWGALWLLALGVGCGAGRAPEQPDLARQPDLAQVEETVATFRFGPPEPLPPQPISCVGDWDGDGADDVFGDGQVCWGGPGASALTECKQLGIAFSRPCASGDFNGDRLKDMVFAGNGYNGLFLALGTGSRQLNPPFVNYPIGVTGLPMAIADLNGDNRSDVVVWSRGPSSESGYKVLYGSPGGLVYDYFITIGDGYRLSPLITDFDHDGNVDMLLEDTGPLETLTWYTRDPIYLWVQGSTIHVEPAIAMQGADFDGDGEMDLVFATVDISSDLVLIRHGRRDGTFDAPESYHAGPYIAELAVADFNGDGIPDVVVLTTQTVRPPLYVLLGDGHGLLPPLALATPPLSGLAVGDFDGDGRTDLVVGVALDKKDPTPKPMLLFRNASR
jgi:hypothetical protein